MLVKVTKILFLIKKDFLENKKKHEYQINRVSWKIFNFEI